MRWQPGMNLSGLLNACNEMLAEPLLFEWSNQTPRFLLIFTGLYAVIVLAASSEHRNTRPGEEHGSARWGNAKELNRRYRDTQGPNLLMTRNIRIGVDGYKHKHNTNVLVVGGSGTGKTRTYAVPNVLEAGCSMVITDPKGEILRKTGGFLKRAGYEVRVFDLLNPDASFCYNPFRYVRDDKEVLQLITNLIQNTTPPHAQSSDPFWEKSETALLQALMLYLLHEAPPEEQNFGMVMELLGSAQVKEKDENFESPLDILFERLAMRDPESIAVKQYGIYKQAAGVVCSKRLLNQAVGKSLRTHNLKPKKGAQVMRKNEKITALYERLSRDDFGKDDDQQRESNSISNQELLCKGWFLPPNTYDCGSFVVNRKAVVGKEQKSLITATNSHRKELLLMKSLFEEMGGTYRKEGDYFIPNLELPPASDYQLGKYGRMRRSYLKEHRKVLYTNLTVSGTLFEHLAEIDRSCNERMENIVSAMAKQEKVTEVLKATDQMEWVRRMNNIRNRAEEIVLTELVYA